MPESLGFLTEDFAVGGGGGPTTLPVFQVAGTRYGNASANPPVPVPASVASGDFIIIAAFIDSGTVTVTPPTGFSHHALSPGAVSPGQTNQHKLAVMYKFATGADTGTYAIGLSASTFTYARAFRYTNVNTTTPWDTGGVFAQSGASNVTTTPAVTMTPGGPNRKLLYFATDWNGDGGTWGSVSGWTQREGGASVTNVFLADKDFAVAASTGATSFTCGTGKAGSLLTGLLGV
jgi:hypothetical protein